MRFDSATADRITAIALFALGAAMSYGGYAMDRLEIRQIHPSSIPGLVPMILGVALMVCAVLLAMERRSATGDGDAAKGGQPAVSWFDLLVTAGWSCIFALVLIGRLPFAVATAIYIAGFTGWFVWQDGAPGRPILSAIFIVVFSIGLAVGVSTLFQYGFLVRLP